MINPNKVPTTEHINLVYDEGIESLDRKLEGLIEYLQKHLDSIPEQDRHTAKFEYEAGYYDDSPTYHISYTRTRTQEEITEANARIELRKAEIQAWIAKLDAEQDAANEAMNAEIAAIQNGAETEIERLEYMIAEAKANAIDAEAAITDEYTAIIKEARGEAERARQVEHNMKALVGSPT